MFVELEVGTEGETFAIVASAITGVSPVYVQHKLGDAAPEVKGYYFLVHVSHYEFRSRLFSTKREAADSRDSFIRDVQSSPTYNLGAYKNTGSAPKW